MATRVEHILRFFVKFDIQHDLYISIDIVEGPQLATASDIPRMAQEAIENGRTVQVFQTVIAGIAPEQREVKECVRSFTDIGDFEQYWNQFAM